MKDLFLIIAGFTGTLGMTLTMLIIGLITGKRLNVIRYLSMIIFSGKLNSIPTSFKISIAAIIHFMTGIVYAFIYAWLWSSGIGKPIFFYSIIFGIFTGVLALSVWNFLISLQTYRFNIPIKTFNTGLFISHIIFSFIVFYTYLFLERYPLPLDQSLNCG